MRKLARTREQREKNEEEKRQKQIPLFRDMWKRGYVGTANRGIRKVEAKLHRINLSGDYGYITLKSRLGDLADLTSAKGNQNTNYDKKYFRKFEKFNLTAFVNPKHYFMPPCYLNILPTTDVPLNSHKTFLENLNDKLPGLKVSSVEYAVDVFCDSLMENNILFSVVSRTLYVPSQKEVSFPYEQAINYGGKKIQYNGLCYTGDRTKYYQRGEDGKKEFIRKNKKGKEEWGWKVEDLDRVRLEFTANRREKFIKCGIGDLCLFIENPKFWEMNKGKWQFKEFKSKKYPLPFPWEKRIFQEVYIEEYIKINKHIYQATTTSQSVEPLKSKLDFAMQKFDVDWSGDYIISDRKLIKIPY
jgi:hypothetical protein